MINIRIHTGNAIFQDDNKQYEVSKILQNLAQQIQINGLESRNIIDTNGNSVGEVLVTTDTPNDELDKVLFSGDAGAMVDVVYDTLFRNTERSQFDPEMCVWNHNARTDPEIQFKYGNAIYTICIFTTEDENSINK